MFVDKVQVVVRAGKGGDGVVSFRHEKFIDKGGPDGGDGGKGGDIIVVASNSQNTLAKYRFQNELVAQDGKAGAKRRKAGRQGLDLEVKLPVGTVVTNDRGDILADLVSEGQRVLISKGGKGGFGNGHFKSSTRQAPKFAEKGEPGEEYMATFEMKMIADVGLVGLPNAGKSTLISAISNAKPQIANYPFTTLIPNLGVVDIYNEAVLFADIPGLIEGASQGKGLGDEFLRHVERTKVILHLIDINSEDIIADYKTIQQELADYKVDLTRKPQVVAITKIETADPEYVALVVDQIRSVTDGPVLAISSLAKQHLSELKQQIQILMQQYNDQDEEEEQENTGTVVIRLERNDDEWAIENIDEGFIVRGVEIERFAVRTDYENEEAIARLKDILRKKGIMHALERGGIEAGQVILFGDAGKVGRIEY